MPLKHVYMDWKFQRTFEFDISFSLEHFFISVAIFSQVASAPLSLVENLKSLPPNKKLLAKSKIMTVLIEMCDD